MIKIILNSQDVDYLQQLISCLRGNKDIQVLRCGKSADEAIHIYHKLMPDVLLIDLHYSGKSGFFAIHKIIKQNKNINIVVSATVLPYFYLKKLARLGVLGFITKQSKPFEVMQAIASTMQKKPYFSPEIVSSVFNSHADEKSAFCTLTKGEFEIAYMVLQNMNNFAIAQELKILPSSVSDRKRILYKKLGIVTDADLVDLACKDKLIEC